MDIQIQSECTTDTPVFIQALLGLMHLGLKNRPFVPHILYQVIGALFL
jgi:hypothetical protein